MKPTQGFHKQFIAVLISMSNPVLKSHFCIVSNIFEIAKPYQYATTMGFSIARFQTTYPIQNVKRNFYWYASYGEILYLQKCNVTQNIYFLLIKGMQVVSYQTRPDLDSLYCPEKNKI